MEEAVSEKGVFQSGGVGLYVFLGASDSGKNYCLEHQIRQAVLNGMQWRQVLIISQTAAHSHQWDFLKQLFPIEDICIRKNPSDLILENKQRTKECEDMFKLLSPEAYEEWKIATQRLVIIDDQAGVINFSSSVSNPYYNYIATCRHLCSWTMLLVQYRSNTGPGFIMNCRVILSWAGDEESMKKVFSLLSIPGYKKNLERIQQWMSTRYNFVLLWKCWDFVNPITKTPMYVEKVSHGNKMFIVS